MSGLQTELHPAPGIPHRAGPWPACLAPALALPFALLLAAPAPALTLTSAVKGLSCAGARSNAPANFTCSAGEFTVSPTFSAEPGTPPFCTAGAEFNFKVDLALSGTNTDRYDIGFFVGQQGNDPKAVTAGNICSVATFPIVPTPWEDDDGDACGDFDGTGNDTIRIEEIKVVCTGDATGALAIPYLLTYRQNTGTACSGPGDVNSDSGSKCNAGTATVSGVVAVAAGAYVDITKQTLPDGSPQSFNFTATGPAGAKVSALTGATLTPTSATGGSHSPATLSAATNSTTFALQDGQTARVYMNALASAQTLTIVESASTGWDPTAAISCSNVRGTPTITTNGTTRTITLALSQANSAAACTLTNTRPPTLQLTKVSTGDVGSFTFTGNNGWSSQTLTTTTAGVGVAGARQMLAPSVATILSEGAVAGFRMAAANCSGLGAGGAFTADLNNRTLAFDAAAMAPGADISCTVTNARQRTLTVTKSLAPATDAGQFVLNANGTAGAAGGNGATASAVVDVGAPVTFGESGSGTTALANYATTHSCNTTPVTSGSGGSGSFVMPNADVACTLANTRRSATLQLGAAWVNAIANDTATTTSSGFGNDASSGALVSTGNNATTGAAVTVYAGESGAIASSIGPGNSANYSATLSCSGNNAALAGNTLTIDPADTAIACTVTQTRKAATLTLRKAWVNGAAGDTATVSSSGFANNASTGVSTASGNNVTSSAGVTVYAAESGSIAEVLDPAIAANYTAVLDCSGNATALAGSTLTVAPADTVITCTFTNTRKQPLLALLKFSTVVADPVHGTVNPKSIPGAVRHYTLRLTNSGPGKVDDDSLVLSDPLPASMELYVGDLAGPGLGPLQFVDGSPSSGLSFTFVSLASTADGIDFSSDNGATWSYVPTPDANGYDPAVTHIRLRPQGAMNAANGGDPSAEMIFRMRLK
ncbi:MAG: prealbumin-like fold domain-containing protein [Pseudomonadota bacterium]